MSTEERECLERLERWVNAKVGEWRIGSDGCIVRRNAASGSVVVAGEVAIPASIEARKWSPTRRGWAGSIAHLPDAAGSVEMAEAEMRTRGILADVMEDAT